MVKKRELKVGMLSTFIASLMVLVSIFTFPLIHQESYAAPIYPSANQANDWVNASNGLPLTTDFYNVVFGDFNNDGKLDLACGAGGFTFDGIHAFIGDGQGNWIEQSNGLPTTGETTDMEVSDINNDGKLDILANGRIYTGNGGVGGSMVWTEQTSPGGWIGVAVGDVNNDGKPDIVTGGNLRVWTGNGALPFVWTDSSGSLPSLSNFWGIALGDINNDGKLDIVVANNSGGIEAWTGNGGTGASAVWTDATGTGLPTLGAYATVYLGDINHDGNLDIVAGIQSGGVKAFTGNGGVGGFVWTEESNGLDNSDMYFQVVLGDISRDGNLDIVAGDYYGGIRVWGGNGGQGGSMSWTSAQNGLPLGSVLDVNLGDVNNDGKLDIAAATSNIGVQVWLNNYPDFVITGYNSISSGLPVTNKWYDVIFGDLNNDGKLDLAASSAANLGVRVWNGDGTGVWTPTISQPTLTGNYNGLSFTDVDHDGKLDLVGTIDDGSAVKVWFGDGTGLWTETAVPASEFAGGGVEVVDVNHDGNRDIITCEYIANTYVHIFLGDGAGGWSTDSGPSETNGYDDVALGDINHDGDIDLISTSMAAIIETRFWLGDGSGSNWNIQNPGIPTTGVYLGAAFGDVNNDGNLDAGLAGYAGASMMKVYTSDGGAGGTVDWTDESSGLPTVNGYAGIEFGDLDIDGNLDIIFANRSGGVDVRRGNGGDGGSMSWTDAWQPNLPISGGYWGIALGDVDNDGKLEIGVTKDNGIEVWKISLATSTNQLPELFGSQVVPSSGDQGTLFTYNVTYRDADNETPAPVPYLKINKGGLPFGASPYPMTPQNWLGPVGNYSIGRNYSYSIALTDCGDDYSFLFNASDGIDIVFTPESTGPLVNCIPETRYLGVQGYLEGSTEIMHITYHTPDLNWTFYDQDGDSQTQYEVRVGTASGLSNMWAPGIQAGATMSVTYGGLTLYDGTDYWFGIRVFDGFGWSSWNETQFHMNSLPSAAVMPIDPVDDSNIPASPGQTLSWTSGGADPDGDLITYYWYIDVNNPPVAPYIASGFTTSTSSTSFATSPSTDYYWYVNATDGWEWNSTIVWNFTTSTIVNNPPEALDLAVQTFYQGTAGILNITDHTPILSWAYYDPESIPQTQYEVRVGSAPSLANLWSPGVQTGAITMVTYSGADLIDGTDYWFGVRVYDGNVWSLWNETRFHMNTIPPSPITPDPQNGAVGLIPGIQTISWNTAIDVENSPLTYYWYVGLDAFFTSIYDNGTTPTTSATFTTDQAITYYWSVRAHDTFEFGLNSTTWNFTTNRVPILDWTGELNYEDDGVNPDSGDYLTNFEFRVKYTDEDNQTGAVRLIILEDSVEILNETMDEFDPSDNDYTDGKLYTTILQLSQGIYTYYFYATDTVGAVEVTAQNILAVSNAIGTIRGIVFDKYDITLENVKVELMKSDSILSTTYTNANGMFEFSDVEYGNYTVYISKSGYQVQTKTANLDQPLLEFGVQLIKIEEQPEFIWWPIFLILVIIIVIILLILLLLKRRKKKDESKISNIKDISDPER